MRSNHPEVIEKRTLDSKTYRTGENTFRLIKQFEHVHYFKDGKLEEIDLTWRDVEDFWFIDEACYECRVSKTSLDIFYKSQSGERWLLLNAPDPFLDGDVIRWEGDGYGVVIAPRPSGIAVETRLDMPIVLDWKREGQFGSEVARDAQERLAEIVNGTLTGRVAQIKDKRTRQREWVSDLQFPVILT